MIKGTAPKEDVTLVNIYALNIGVPKYVRKILMDIKEEFEKTIVIIGENYKTLK